MIALDTTNISETVIGKSHGLDLKSVYDYYSQQMQEHITHLWDNRNTQGGWRRWLNLGDNPQLIGQIKDYARSVKGKFDHLVIIGIGGSSLGALAMFEALLPSYWNERTKEQRNGFPKYYFVDNVDPDKLAALLDVLDLNRTLINVITKSGTTAETMAGYLWLKGEMEKAVGKDKLNQHFVMTTDAQKGVLRKIVDDEGFVSFEVPDDVGGRFSVFSAVGLLPATLLGIDVEAVLQGVRDLVPIMQNTDIQKNPAAQAALIQYMMGLRGKHISVFMPYSAKLAFVADWYVQLWAESLGKRVNLENQVVHEGPTPVKAVGVTDQHSQVQLFNEGPFDKVFTFVRVGGFDHELTIPNLYADVPDLNYLGGKTFGQLLQAEGDATRASLTRNQRPNMTLTLPRLDGAHFGQLLYFLEVQTALAGSLLNVDPFDQPGVELAKQYTYALMGRPGFEHLRDEAAGKLLQPSL